MKWVNVSLVLAGLFITGVLVYLILQGVHLKERRMIKWSNVVSAELAGQKVGRFIFPFIQQKGRLRVYAPNKFGQQFYTSLQEEVLKNNSEARITLSSQKMSKDEFLITVKSLGEKEPIDECAMGIMSSCAEKTAIRKFAKKKVASEGQWISMYRLGENEAILFYKQKKK